MRARRRCRHPTCCGSWLLDRCCPDGWALGCRGRNAPGQGRRRNYREGDGATRSRQALDSGRRHRGPWRHCLGGSLLPCGLRRRRPSGSFRRSFRAQVASPEARDVAAELRIADRDALTPPGGGGGMVRGSWGSRRRRVRRWRHIPLLQSSHTAQDSLIDGGMLEDFLLVPALQGTHTAGEYLLLLLVGGHGLLEAEGNLRSEALHQGGLQLEITQASQDVRLLTLGARCRGAIR
mmetsp:Transcript_63482/g.139768  ORF Transcript_63482/g.139768 Transcript_63482/m.139768 type:complete len:235 (+) Transcript_63482:234-938(+)